MLGKRPFALLVAAVAALVSARADAGGWQEVHETSDDVRIEVHPDGIADVQHHLRYRVVAGRFKTFELVGVDPRAVLAPEAVFVQEKNGAPTGAEVLARVEPVDGQPGKVRIMIDEGKGLGRGTYVVDVRYRLDLVATKMLRRDGAMWKLAWTAPPAPEGHDGARVTFDLPSAPTEPRLAGAAESATTLATLRRSATRDELELVRAHVPRGEAVTWAARVDPKAFPAVVAPELRAPPAPERAHRSILSSHGARIAVAAGFVLLSTVLALLLRSKRRAFRAAAATRDAEAQPLVRLPWGDVTTPVAYGVTTSLGLALLLWSSPAAGAVLVALAMALAAHRGASPLPRPRRRGVWKTLPAARALVPGAPAPLPSDALDAGTTRGRVALVTTLAVVAAGAWLLRTRIPQIGIALPLASVALVPLFVTGTRAQLGPGAIELAAKILRPTRDALAKAIDLAHVELEVLGRVVDGEATAPNGAEIVDEVRLTCAPRDRTPGLRSIEVALSPCRGGHEAMPEVFVRFDDGSAAAERVARLASGAPALTGRSPDERVVRLTPDEPAPAVVAELVARLLLGLEGRRATDARADEAAAEPDARAPESRGGREIATARWTGPERRRRRRPGAASARGLLGVVAPANASL